MKNILYYISLFALIVHTLYFFCLSDEKVLKMDLELFIRDFAAGVLFGIIALSTKPTKNDEK